jgi:hypothetical protein
MSGLCAESCSEKLGRDHPTGHLRMRACVVPGQGEERVSSRAHTSRPTTMRCLPRRARPLPQPRRPQPCRSPSPASPAPAPASAARSARTRQGLVVSGSLALAPVAPSPHHCHPPPRPRDQTPAPALLVAGGTPGGDTGAWSAPDADPPPLDHLHRRHLRQPRARARARERARACRQRLT